MPTEILTPNPGKSTDARAVAAEIYLLPVATRIPLKFGPEVVTKVTLARAKVTLTKRAGCKACGWGETPLSVQWVWPSTLSYDLRHEAILDFLRIVAKEWLSHCDFGHPIEIGARFQRDRLGSLLADFNRSRAADEKMPLLAGLLCCSILDIATHDAYGELHGMDIYATYNSQFMNANLAEFIAPAAGSTVSFANLFPDSFLTKEPPTTLPVWHLVGGLDRIHPSDPDDSTPDGFPTLLSDWIARDGLTCLKIKLKGIDAAWDYQRIVDVGKIAIAQNVQWLSTDFNCTVKDVAYVNAILDRLLREQPRIYGMILYVEQPFPYELEVDRLDVRSVVARKPLFMDESAHDWQHVRLGRELGWSGVALKTCKTQTGALLSASWARAHGMTLMVQDLTNPMLAMIPHARLAAHVGTIMGVESNASQFYPNASMPEANVHPGLYRRNNGHVDLSTLRGPGFGYRVNEMKRELPSPWFVQTP